MFIAKLKQHQKRFKTLAANRAKLLEQGVFERRRLALVEHQLLNHLYAISDLDEQEVGAELALLTKVFDDSSPWQNIIEHATNNKKEFHLFELIAASYLADIETDLMPHIEHVRYQNCDRMTLVMASLSSKIPQDLKAFRQSALMGSFEPDAATAAILFGQINQSQTELLKAYEHNNIDIAMSALIIGFVTQAQGWSKGFFSRFYKCDAPKDKARLLSLAGLGDNADWYDTCREFCLNQPQFATEVLSHFQSKQHLSFIIELLAETKISESVYQAWLNLTAIPLLTTTEQGKSGFNCRQAELFRQDLMQQPGSHMLFGRAYNLATADKQLAGLGGKLIQRAQIHARSKAWSVRLFEMNLSEKQWLIVEKNGSKQNAA